MRVAPHRNTVTWLSSHTWRNTQKAHVEWSSQHTPVAAASACTPALSHTRALTRTSPQLGRHACSRGTSGRSPILPEHAGVQGSLLAVVLCWQLAKAGDEGCSHAEAVSAMGAHVTVAGYLFSLQWYKCSLQNSTFPATANENTWCIYAKAPSHSW